jgi:hypothetical protein
VAVTEAAAAQRGTLAVKSAFHRVVAESRYSFEFRVSRFERSPGGSFGFQVSSFERSSTVLVIRTVANSGRERWRTRNDAVLPIAVIPTEDFSPSGGTCGFISREIHGFLVLVRNCGYTSFYDCLLFTF